jgi:CHAT domain-containing protein
MTPRLIIAGLAAALALATGAAAAQTRADVVALGRSATSGAVCQAFRDYDDPVALGAGRRAWAVRCRGWDGVLGRLYALDKAADAGSWQNALAGRATCAEPKSQPLAGLTDANRRACRTAAGKAAYLAYDAKRGSGAYAADGVAQIADVLETGLRVVSGAARPPKMAEVQTSAASAEIAADFGGATGGLARAQAAAAADPARLRTRGYVRNNEWRFDQAETDFQALVADAETRGAPPGEMAEALLNLALNVSDNGRYAEADKLFADADIQVRAAQDRLLAVQADTYRALHLRNAGRFAEAVAAGRRALQAQGRADAAVVTGTPKVSVAAGGDVGIGAELSRALNTRPGGGDMATATVSTGDRLAVQEAQALEVIGSSLSAQGDAAGGRAALARAAQMLDAAEANGAVNAWLRARVEADLAQIDVDAGRFGPAADRLASAVQVMRRRHAGTAAEGGLLLELGSAQAAAGREDAALASFGRAFSLFQAQRGALGASADQAAPYFDLLLKRIESDPSRADDYRNRFFNAAESVVSNATAQTVSKLAARVASGDGAITGLVRALDDTRRELRATEGRVAALQSENAYVGEDRTELSGQLLNLQQQADTLEAELLSANPRYAQLVSSQASLADLQKALRVDEVYVKLLLLGPRSFGVLVSRTAMKPYAIPITRIEAGAAVQRLRRPFEAEDNLPAFDVAGSYELYRKLLGPVEPEVLASKHLIYDPDGSLISLPVATLVSADPAPLMTAGKEVDYRKVQWLGTRLDSSLVLSAASFMQSRSFSPSRARQDFLAFADPATPARTDGKAYASVIKRGTSRRGGNGIDLSKVCESTREALLGLPPLPDTADEVRQVGASIGRGRAVASEALITGASFSDESVKARGDLSDFKVLYFATHGLLPQPSACLPEPALVTSVGAAGDSDGLLDASEILDLKLDADLVVLSACDTGGAGGGATSETGLQGGGEALGGLTRAVIYAGGRSLIVSHWSVDSAATVRLMTGLFSADTPSEAESLQKAQAVLQQSEAWSHPYFWAPFTIVGDGSRPIPTAGKAVAD